MVHWLLKTSKVLQYLSLDPKIQVIKGDADLSTKGYGSCETEEDQKEKKDEFILILLQESLSTQYRFLEQVWKLCCIGHGDIP